MKTLSQFSPEFKQWVENAHSLSLASRRYYSHGLDMLLKTSLASLPLDKISNHNCETVTFSGGAANSNTALRTLRRMLAKAEEMNLIQKTPKIKLRREEGRSIAMSRTDAAQISARMIGDAKDAFEVLRATGMRPGECFSLRWEFVNFEKAVYCNPRGKTRSAKRAIPLLYESVSVLQRRHLAYGMPREGWVFPSTASSGHLMSIQKPYTKARKASGLPSGMCLYTARHGALTDLASVVSLAEVMKIGGHSDSKTALQYQHQETTRLQHKLDSYERIM